ncbi:MAG: hypothetical protein E7589_00735 [Ruminococcaceae bacterium]|nr:hypothetical protein [Oscillospiraceae bacterium]
MRITRYDLTTSKPNIRFKAAVVADLHDMDYSEVLPILERESADMIFIPGDLTESLDLINSNKPRLGLEFLKRITSVAPTFYSFGNHEVGACHKNLRHASTLYPNRIAVLPEWREMILSTGATLLDEDYVVYNDLAIGGLGSGLLNPRRVPKYQWIEKFASNDCYKILLCHQPEYFDRYLRPYDIDLFVSGHAHGGQWRIFGRGVYAPDQSLFPKYTSGVHENRLVISRGVSNSARPIPRFFNPREVVIITVQSK